MHRGLLRAGLALTALGVLYALLPMDWIEEHWHVSPDGGSGLLEVLIPAGLIVAGGLMLARVWVLRRRAARSAPR